VKEDKGQFAVRSRNDQWLSNILSVALDDNLYDDEVIIGTADYPGALGWFSTNACRALKMPQSNRGRMKNLLSSCRLRSLARAYQMCFSELFSRREILA